MKPLEQAIETSGGLSDFARKVGVSPQVVCNWKARGRVPAERVLDVESATGVTRYELRPDIFGPAPKPRRKAEQQKAA